MRRFLLLFAAVFLSLSAVAETSSHTLTNSSASSPVTNTTTDGFTWTISWTGTSATANMDSSKGFKIGSGKKAPGTVTIKSTGFSDYSISSVTINLAGNSSTKATTKVSVNGTTYLYGEAESYTVSSSSTDVKFTGDQTGEIEIIVNVTNTDAIYIKSITVEYTTGGGGSETLSFDKSSVELTYGDVFTAPTLDHADGLTINWSSTNTDVATVDGKGIVKIEGIGTTKITATDASDNTNTASYTLKVVAPETNPSYQIVFSSGSDNSTGASLSNCIESGSEYVSNISTNSRAYANCENGIKLGSGSGAGTITLTLSKTGSVRATKVVVNAITYSTDATTISVNGATAQDLTSSLEDYTFTLDNSLLTEIKITSGGSNPSKSRCYVKSITVYYTDDSTIEFTNTAPEATYGEDFTEPILVNKSDDKTYKWESDNTDVAEVNSDGKLTIKNVGTAVIKVTEQETSKTASYTLTVKASSKVGLAFYAGTFIVLKDATKDFVEPVLINPNGLENITYTTSDDKVAIVDNTGEIAFEDELADGARVTITASVEAQGNYTAGSASYTIIVKEAGSVMPKTYTDVLTADFFNAEGTAYTSYNVTSEQTNISYQGTLSKNNGMQFNKHKNYPGIVITANPNNLVLKSITVKWYTSSTSAGTEIQVWGANAGIESTTELGAGASVVAPTESLFGTDPIITIAKNNESTVNVDGIYNYVGFRAIATIQIESITLEWEGVSAVPEYSSTLTLGKETVNDVKANTLSLAKVGDDLGSYNVYLNSTEIGAANNECNYLPYLTNGNFTISDGITAYALTTNQFSYDFTQQEGEVTDVQYIALREDKYLVPGKTDEWYLSAEYTIAPKESALKGMAVTLSDFQIMTEGHGELSAFNGNKVTVAKVGTFKFVTNKVDDKDVTTAVYTIDEECLFGVNLNFPFFVYGSLKDMMQKSLGVPTLSTIKSTKQTAVYVGEVAQPDDTEGTGNVSGVESVVVDSEGAVEYYNLQGVRVEGALTPGIYIRRTATGTSKVAIR